MAKQRRPIKKDEFEEFPVQPKLFKKHFHMEFLNVAQKMAFSAFEQHDVLFLLGPAGTGKALTLDANLYTRTGPIKMGSVKIGDEIANPDGTFSKITGIFPQGKKRVCRVHFSDETYVDCSDDHLWSVSHSDNGWKDRVVNTSFIAANCRRKDGKRLLSIRCSKPVGFDRKSYLLDPYVLGVILSEGNVTNSNVVFTTCESEVLDRVGSLIDNSYVCKSKGIDRRIVKKKRSGKPNVYKDELKRLAVWGKYAWEKFIPTEYLYGSVDQRMALLQGLMDGDGTIEKTGSISYSTTSWQLASDLCQLVYSLGGTTRIKRKEGSRKLDGTRYRVSYRCYLNLPSEVQIFFLTRKKRLVKCRVKYFPKRYIDRVEYFDEKEMQCIAIDHPSRLYLTDNFTVTHNTHLACAFAINEITAKKKKRIIITRPIVESGERLGFLPGTFEEKVHPYMMPIYDCVGKLVGYDGPEREKIDKVLEKAPLAYLRGRTFDNAVAVFDEAQNASYMQLKLFLTRMGENCKVIITGDPRQSDIPGPVDLVEVVKRLESVNGIGIIEFKANSIVRHPLVGSIIEKLEDKD